MPLLPLLIAFILLSFLIFVEEAAWLDLLDDVRPVKTIVAGTN